MDTNADQYYKDCDESDADAHNACYAGADDYHADADEADIADKADVADTDTGAHDVETNSHRISRTGPA